MTHLRRVMLEELQRRNYAKTTVETYMHAVEQFAKHFKRPPDRLTLDHLRTYQAYLLRERTLGVRTVRLHVAALRFFFVKALRRPYTLDDTPYPKAPRRLPTILTIEEVKRLIEAARTLTERTMLMVLYSTGMRNAEMRHLQVRDIDSQAMLIHIQHGKGGRDRYVPLSATLLPVCRCKRCGRHWHPRTNPVRRCRWCRTQLWNLAPGKSRQGKRTDLERRKVERRRSDRYRRATANSSGPRT